MISSTIHDGTTQAKRNFAPGSRRAAQIAGTANPVNTAAGQNVTQYNTK